MSKEKEKLMAPKGEGRHADDEAVTPRDIGVSDLR